MGVFQRALVAGSPEDTLNAPEMKLSLQAEVNHVSRKNLLIHILVFLAVRIRNTCRPRSTLKANLLTKASSYNPRP